VWQLWLSLNRFYSPAGLDIMPLAKFPADDEVAMLGSAATMTG